MLATITAALMMFYAAATARAEAIVHRIHDATVALVSLDRQMIGRLACAVVPDFMYLEYKSLYRELKPFFRQSLKKSIGCASCAIQISHLKSLNSSTHLGVQPLLMSLFTAGGRPSRIPGL